MAIAGYKLKINGGAYTDHIVDVGNVLAYDLTGLAASTSYTVQVEAYDAAPNESAYSSGVSQSTDAEFSPASISNLYMWLKADAIVGLVNSDPVATWEDSSVANHDATQATGANKPLYKTNIVNTLPVVRFDGSNDYLELVDLSALTAGEIFYVWKVTGNSGGNYIRGAAGNIHFYPYSDGKIYENFGSTARKDNITPGIALTNFHICNIFSASGDYGINLNGSSIYTSASNTVEFPGPSPLPRIGDNASAGAMNVDIAEVILYSRKLTGTERGNVYTYLSGKYAI